MGIAFKNIKLLYICVFVIVSGCDNNTVFDPEEKPCEPNAASARWGKNPGPVILIPAAAQSASQNLSIAGSCENGYEVKVSGAGVVGESAVECFDGKFSARIEFTKGDDIKSVQVAQATFNEYDIVDRVCFLNDTVSPVVEIVPPNSKLSFNESRISVAGRCESGLDVILRGIGLVASVTTECVEGEFATDVVLSQQDGIKTVEVIQVDRAGNEGEDEQKYFVDTHVPVVKVEMPGEGGFITSGAQLQGSCESGLKVQINTGTQLPITVDCVEGYFDSFVAVSSVDGVKAIEVSQIDLVGNIGRFLRSLMRDTKAPIIEITDPAANSEAMEGVSIQGNCEDGLEVNVTGTGINDLQKAICDKGLFSVNTNFSDGDGAKSIVVTQLDAAGNRGQYERVFVRDSVAPLVRIISPEAGGPAGNETVVTGECEAGYSVEFSGAGVKNVTIVGCPEGRFQWLIQLSEGDGTKIVIASQTDAAGNRGEDTKTFIRDTESPIVEITGPQAGQAAAVSLIIEGVCENDTDVDFSGSGIREGMSSKCQAGVFSSEVVFTAGEGEKEIIVGQTDAAGNKGEDKRIFVRDSLAPIVTIVGPVALGSYPEGLTLQGSCESDFAVNISGAGVLQAKATNCIGGAYTSDIKLGSVDGVKNIVVSQVDQAGNVGTDNRDFVRDSVAPLLVILSPQEGQPARVGLSVEGECESKIAIKISGEGLASPQSGLCVNGHFGVEIIFTPGDGTKNIIFSQTDEAGNTTVRERTFSRDSAAPALAITSPDAKSYVVDDFILAGRCESGLLVRVSGSGLAIPAEGICADGIFGLELQLSANDGVKNVVVEQIDTAGNRATDNRDFQKDTKAPVMAIVSPLADMSFSTGLHLAGTCESGLDVKLTELGMASAQLTACKESSFELDIIFSAGDGEKTLIASQEDAAGNISKDQRNFLRDSQGPELKITAPATNTYFSSSAQIKGQCESGLEVRLSGDGVAQLVKVMCQNNQFQAEVELSQLDGVKTILVSQSDRAGNETLDSRNLIKDSMAPKVTVLGPQATGHFSSDINLFGSCETGIDVSIEGTGVATMMSVECQDSKFAGNVLLSPTDGDKSIVVSQIDLAGNQGKDTRLFVKDSVAPNLSIVAPNPNASFADRIQLVGRCEVGIPILLLGEEVVSPSQTACEQGKFSVAVYFSEVDGLKSVSVSQTDLAGNSSVDQRSFRFDGSAPNLTILSPNPNSFHSDQLQLIGACESGLDVVISGPGIVGILSTLCIAGQFSAQIKLRGDDGIKNFIVSQEDEAGNQSSVNRDFIKDTLSPNIQISGPPANSSFGEGFLLEGSCEGGLQIILSGDGVTSPLKAICEDDKFSVEINLTEGDGAKTVIVSQQDLAGNMGTDQRVFSRDGTAPNLSILSPLARAQFRDALFITGTCESDLKVVFMGSGVASLVETICVDGQYGTEIKLSSEEGVKLVITSQTDLAGNQSKVTREYIKDSIAPAITINSPSANGYFSGAVLLAGTCEPNIFIAILGTGVSGAINIPCDDGGQFSTNIELSEGDGVKLITVSQEDQAGNRGKDERSVYKDSLVPELRIASPAALSSYRESLTMSGKCESNLPVNLGGEGLISPAIAQCEQETFTTIVRLTDGDGEKSISITQVDAAGNEAQDQRIFIKDSLPPNIGIDFPTANSFHKEQLSLKGHCESGLKIMVTGTGLENSIATSCVNELFAVDVTLSAAEGIKKIVVSQTDGAGNIATDQREFVKDITAPELAFLTPAAGTLFTGRLTITGQCETGIKINLVGDDIISPKEILCAANSFSVRVKLTAGDGEKMVAVSQTDAAGNSSTDNRVFVLDTQAPSIQISTPLAGSFHQTELILIGTCETGLAVTLGGEGAILPVDSTCVNGGFRQNILLNGVDGEFEITVTQVDGIGNLGSDSRHFYKDTVEPKVSITSPDPMSAHASGVSLEGLCESGLSVVIVGENQERLGQVDCSLGSYIFDLMLAGADGTKAIRVEQVDEAGNMGFDLRSLIKDTEAPVLGITGPVAGSLHSVELTLVGICEVGYPVEISGTGAAKNATANCSQGDFFQTIGFAVGEGSKEIVISQTDGAGNVATDSRQFVNDSLEPTVTISSPAENTSWPSEIVIAGDCEVGLPVVLSGGGLLATTTVVCEQDKFTKNIILSVGDGAKEITVSQTDLAGNQGIDSRMFYKDNVAPLIKIQSPARNSFSAFNVTITGDCESGVPIIVTGQGVANQSEGLCEESKFSMTLALSQGDGTKIVKLSQTDSAGNQGSDTRNFIQDTESPRVKITGPAARSFASKGLVLAGTCEQGITVKISGAGIKSEVAGSCPEGGFWVDVELSEGETVKQIIASQTDEAGNTGSDQREFIRDDGPPKIKITAPSEDALTASSLTLSGTCETGLQVQITSSKFSSVAVACEAAKFSKILALAGVDGRFAVKVAQVDLAAQEGSDERTFRKDTLAPAVNIVSPSEMTAATAELNLKGQCESDLPVVIWGTGVDIESSVNCLAGAYSSVVNFSSGNGIKEIHVSQTDLAGNFKTVTRNFVRDDEAPLLNITSPAENSIVISGFVMSGLCESGIRVEIRGQRLRAATSVMCQSGQFSTNLDLIAGEGIKLIYVSQTDAAGNEGIASRQFITDETAPQVAILEPQANSTVASSVNLQGTCEAGLNVNISGTGVKVLQIVSCSDGTFASSVPLSDGEGLKLVLATQTDSSGNRGESERNFVKDSLAPTLTITGPAANTAGINGVNLVGECEKNLVIEIVGSGARTNQTASCSNGGKYSAKIDFSDGDGEKVITLTQTDAAGNIGSETRSFIRDTQAPQIVILTPAENSTHGKSFDLTGQCEVGILIDLAGDVRNARKIPCQSGAFAANIIFAGVAGPKLVKVQQIDALGNIGRDQRQLTMTNATGKDSFTITGEDNQVDILFVDDNSASMEFEQRELGDKFSSFSEELTQLNWQIGITTTDCSTGPYGICGSLLPLEGMGGQTILNPFTPSFELIFKMTIERPETIDCVLTGTCPSGKEQPFLASMTAMSKRSTSNSGFFRNNSDLAIVILSDEDEQSSGPASATQPEDVIRHFTNIWPEDKQISVYGIVIQTGDEECLGIQKEQSGGNAFYGTSVERLAGLTSGITVSICADNYNAALKKIGANVRKLTESVELTQDPVAGTVQVNFIPSQDINWTVEGRRVIFESSPQVGTTIEVLYEVIEK